MERVAIIIAESYVWDNVVFQKVMKRGFKEVSNAEFAKWVGSRHPEALTNYDELKKQLYRHFLRLADEFNQSMDDTYDDEVDFVRKEGYDKNLFDVKANGTAVMPNGKSALVDRLKMLLANYNREVDNGMLKDHLIKSGLNILVDDLKLEKLDKLRKKVAYDPNVKVDWKNLVKMMRIDKNNPNFENLIELHERMIKHTIWQIKRKLNDQEVKWHTALILHGKQGCGKSDFLKKLFAPLEELYILIDGSTLNDKFGNQIFNDHFVGNLDELTKIGDKSIELVKQFITMEKATSRKMHTEVHQETKQNMTIVGSSNRPINKVIYDFTGMRRWWQIDIDRYYDTMDFESIEGANFIDYWRAIDETEEEGFYNGQSKEMIRYQETFRATSSTEDFLDAHGYLNNYNVETVEYCLKRLYKEYTDFCSLYKYPRPQKFPQFRASIQELGYDIASKRPVNIIEWHVRVSKYEEDEFE